MKIVSAAILVVFVPFTTASAQFEAGREASYSCAAAATGGIIYDEETRKWTGTAFRASLEFALRVRFLGTHVGKSFTGLDQTFYDFNVTITPKGSNFPIRCYREFDTPVSATRDNSVLECYADHLYRINLKTNRFLAARLDGYLDGNNDKDRAALVSGGTCLASMQLWRWLPE